MLYRTGYNPDLNSAVECHLSQYTPLYASISWQFAVASACSFLILCWDDELLCPYFPLQLEEVQGECICTFLSVTLGDSLKIAQNEA